MPIRLQGQKMKDTSQAGIRARSISKERKIKRGGMIIMYRLQVRVENEPEIMYAAEPGTRKAKEFKTREEAHHHAEKLRESASLGVWFKIEVVKE